MQASGYNFFVWRSTRFLPGLICISIVEEMVCCASFLFGMVIKQQMSLLVCWASFLFSMIIKQQMSLNIKGQQANLFQHLSS